MPDNAAQTIQKTRLWPLTSDARRRLIEELARVREDLTSLTGQGLEEGIVQLPVALTARRLESLKDVLDRAEIVDDVPCAAIGRRARRSATTRATRCRTRSSSQATATRRRDAFPQTRRLVARSYVRRKGTSSTSALPLGDGP